MRKALFVIALVLVPWLVVPLLVARRVLSADEDLSRWDRDDVDLMAPRSGPTSAHGDVVERLQDAHAQFATLNPRDRVRRVRAWMDSLGESVVTDARIVPVDDGIVTGEWVVAPDADPDRRLLYVHGGAFEAGSPLSHRGLTTELSSRTGASVFAVRYRLQPEHRRRDAIADVRTAWAWLLANGPDERAPARSATLAGDSAGGNLVLGLLAHLRDTGGRQADAAVVFSPLTDSTFSGSSWLDNRDSDPFLGPSIGRLLALPRGMVLTSIWLTSGLRPDDPLASPLLGDLSDLPPTLVQASDDELTRDDAVRYATKARAAGSPAEVQLWPGMVHAFQAFRTLPESDAALGEAASFLGAAASDEEQQVDRAS